MAWRLDIIEEKIIAYALEHMERTLPLETIQKELDISCLKTEQIVDLNRRFHAAVARRDKDLTKKK